VPFNSKIVYDLPVYIKLFEYLLMGVIFHLRNEACIFFHEDTKEELAVYISTKVKLSYI
jgi:hypothetical protein